MIHTLLLLFLCCGVPMPSISGTCPLKRAGCRSPWQPISMDTRDRDFTLRPSQQQKFRAGDGNALVSSVLNELLSGELYDSNSAQKLSSRVAEEVRSRLKGLGLDHYKYIVQVNISEQRGQAAHIVAQCVWDSDCDVMAHSFFSNDSLWCEAVVFAVFHY